MKKRIALFVVFCMCLSLLSGINVQRVKASTSFDVSIDGFGEYDSSTISSAESLNAVISAAAEIVTGCSAGVSITVRLKNDISISDTIEIPDNPNIQWNIKSVDDSSKKINCGAYHFYIYKGNKINFDHIEMDYSGTSEAVILQSSSGQSDGGNIIIHNCAINATVMSDTAAAVRSAGSLLQIENSIITSNAIGVFDNNINDLSILNSTIVASNTAIYADGSSNSNAQVHIEGTSISSDTSAPITYGVDLRNCKQSTIKDCTVNTPRGTGVYALLAPNKTITIDNCNIISYKSAVSVNSSEDKSGSATIKNCSLSADGPGTNATVGIIRASLALEDSEIAYTGSNYCAVYLGSDADGTISRCNINSSYSGVRCGVNYEGTCTISNSNVTADGNAIFTQMLDAGKVIITDRSNIRNTGANKNAINYDMKGTLVVSNGSNVEALSASGHAISTNSSQASNIELNNCTISARNGNTIDLGISNLISEGDVELRCGDALSEGVGYSCICVGENVHSGAIDVRSGELQFKPYKGDDASSTSFAAIKVSGSQPVSISAIFTPTSGCSFDESSYQDGIIYEPITNRSTRVEPTPSYTYYVAAKKEDKVQVSSKKDQKTVIVLDAKEINKLDLSKTDVIRIVLKPDITSGIGADLDLKLDLSALPENIKSLKVNTGANLFSIDGVSNKNDTGLELKLVELNSKKIRANNSLSQPKEASNIIELDCRLDDKSSKTAAKVRIGAKINDIKALSVSDENKLSEDELSYSRVSDSIKKPVWVSIAEDGTVAKLDSEVVTNSETGELMLETAVSGVGTYGVMDEEDADEVIWDQMIESGKTDKFMAWARAGKNSQVIKWRAVENATLYKVYAAKGNGSYKKIAEVKDIDPLTYTNKKTGTATWKYKVIAYSGKEKLGTSVVIYSTYDKSQKAGSKVTLQVTKKSLNVGKTYKLKPVVTGVAKNAAVRYYSSNTMIATVNKNGKITAVNPGVCEIFAYAKDGYYRRIKITVK